VPIQHFYIVPSDLSLFRSLILVQRWQYKSSLPLLVHDSHKILTLQQISRGTSNFISSTEFIIWSIQPFFLKNYFSHLKVNHDCIWCTSATRQQPITNKQDLHVLTIYNISCIYKCLLSETLITQHMCIYLKAILWLFFFLNCLITLRKCQFINIYTRLIRTMSFKKSNLWLHGWPPMRKYI
jgi:hypothetical protein